MSVLCDVILTAWALVLVLRGWRGDLVQRRRKARLGVFGAGSVRGLLYAALWFPVRYGWMNGNRVHGVNVSLDVLLIFGAATAMLGLHPELIAASAGATRQPTGSGAGESNRLAIARLRLLMERQQVWRIEAAKSQLTDPANGARTIADIAFDLGYASLAPFNRAFKEAVGHTPSAWRRLALRDGESADAPHPGAAKAAKTN